MFDWIKMKLRGLWAVVAAHDWCFWCLGVGAAVGFVLGAVLF